jgi:phosphonate transport system permease protein
MSTRNCDSSARLDDAGEAAKFCLTCTLTLLGVAAVIVASFAYLSLGLDRLLSAEAARDMLRFFLSFFPPELSAAYLARVAKGALETLAISALGTLLAALAAMFLALPASGRYGLALRNATRFALNVLRSVPELVWGALMVLAAGLGPFAGTLALALHTAGVLGRLFAETLENAPPEPAGALVETGATPALAFVYGTLPTIVPQLVAYSLYRWEMNIRMAAILGFVGAGGLGQMLYYELSLFRQGEACTVILAMLLLVMVVDGASAVVRRGLARAHS